MTAPALSTRGLAKQFGSLVVAEDIAIELPPGVRYALIGPNGAGKTTLINLMTGMLRPDAGAIFLDNGDITALPPDERVRRGLVRTYQINSLFPHLTVLELVTLVVCERRRVAQTWWRQLAAYSHEIDEAYDILNALTLGRGLSSRRPANCLTASSGSRNRAGAGDQAESAAARRAGGGGAARGKQRPVRRHRRPVARHHRVVHRARHGSGVSLRLPRYRAWSAVACWSKARRPRSPPIRGCARSISARRVMTAPQEACREAP